MANEITRDSLTDDLLDDLCSNGRSSAQLLPQEFVLKQGDMGEMRAIIPQVEALIGIEHRKISKLSKAALLEYYNELISRFRVDPPAPPPPLTVNIAPPVTRVKTTTQSAAVTNPPDMRSLLSGVMSQIIGLTDIPAINSEVDDCVRKIAAIQLDLARHYVNTIMLLHGHEAAKRI